MTEKAVETTSEILYDKRLFDNYDKSDQVLKDYLFIGKVNDRRRPDLRKLNDHNSVMQGFCSQIQFEKKQRQIKRFKISFLLCLSMM